MLNINVTKDIENKTITVDAVYNADQQRVWDAWTHSDQLDKWWGPQGWPATTKSFDFSEGGHWHYKMTGPDGTEAWSWVDYIAIDPTNSIKAKDTFSDAEGNRTAELPNMNWNITFNEEAGKTHVKTVLTLNSEADIKKILEMGFESGYKQGLENLQNYLDGKTVYQS